jgi:DNA-binding NtrC family response regulator
MSSSGDTSSPTSPAETRPAPGVLSLRVRVREATRRLEAEIILETLEQHRWNRRRTAEALGISYRLLMYKMQNCNLRRGIVAKTQDGEIGTRNG